MKARQVFYDTVLIEITHHEFKEITGTQIAKDHYGNGGLRWETVMSNEYDLSSFLLAIRELKQISELKKSILDKIDTAKDRINSAFWPLK